MLLLPRVAVINLKDMFSIFPTDGQSWTVIGTTYTYILILILIGDTRFFFSKTAYDCISYTSPTHNFTNSAQRTRCFLLGNAQLIQISQTEKKNTVSGTFVLLYTVVMYSSRAWGTHRLFAYQSYKFIWIVFHSMLCR